MDLYHYALFTCVAAGIAAALNQKARAAMLVASSLAFYATFDWRFPVILIGIIAITFWGGIVIERARRGSTTASWIFSIAVLVPLLLYKYLLPWFFVALLYMPVSNLDFGGYGAVLVPVGLSFYTFQCLGYLLDVHRGVHAADHNPLRLALFISFLPQLLAGPIERYHHLAERLWNPESIRPKLDMVLNGLMFIAYGMFMKNVVGDRLAVTVDRAYDLAGEGSATNSLIAFLGFTLQLFADFGGYSLIAVGAGMLFGIQLTQNFRQPFFSRNIVEFWQRWHISLTRWVGDYMYRPLGRYFIAQRTLSRFSQEAVTVTITWFVIGLWHGAHLTFAVFGLIQAALILGYKVMPDSPRLSLSLSLRAIIGFIITFTVVVITFGLIRAPDIVSYGALLTDIVQPAQRITDVYFAGHILVGLTVIVSFEFISRFHPDIRVNSVFLKTVIIQTLVISTILLGYSEQRDFVYFRF